MSFPSTGDLPDLGIKSKYPVSPASQADSLSTELVGKPPYIIMSALSLSPVQLCSPWTVAHQAPLCMGFSRQEYWNGLFFPCPEDLHEPGIETLSPVSPALKVDSLPLSHLKNPIS